MYIPTGDIVAVSLLLIAANTVLIIAFRRVAVLESEVLRLRREMRKLRSL